MNSAAQEPGTPRRTPLPAAPAARAVLIQLAAFLLVLGLAHIMPLLADMQLSVGMAALAQGLVAAAISRWCRLAVWWLIIQGVFPVAVLAALALHLPPVIFLIAFLALLGLYWTTYRTQVPYYPSGRALWDAVAKVLPADRAVRFIDIGSGLGGLVLHLSDTRQDGGFTGIEVAPLPWFASWVRARIRRSRARFLRGDYGRLDFSEYDAVFAYLSPAAMPALWRKASTEMRNGALLLSYEFDIPSVIPHFTVTPADGGPVLYGWRM
jgi:SAM-dependent methyltransferase